MWKASGIMRSITVEALWGTDSKCLWCSRNIHVSGALQNPIGLAAFEERQMNNQKGVEGGSNTRGALVKKKRKKWKSEAAFALLGLWSPSSSRHWYTDTHKGTQALSLPLSLPLFSHCLSLSSPSFISSTSLHLYPRFAPGIPPVPQYLPLVCCPGFDMCSQKDQQHTLDPFLQLPRL